MSSTVLEVRNLKRVVEGRVIITNLSFAVHSPGDVLFIRGASGVGKSLLLRVLACLDPLQASVRSRSLIGATAAALPPVKLLVCQEGELLLNERTPQQIGVPNWRALVTYVPQARVQLKGTPSELYFTAQVCKAVRYVAATAQCILASPNCEVSAAIRCTKGKTKRGFASPDTRAWVAARRFEPVLV